MLRLPLEYHFFTIGIIVISAMLPGVRGRCKQDQFRLSLELKEFRLSLEQLQRLFGALPAAQLNAARLDKVGKAMSDSGLSRGGVNQRLGRIRTVWRWAKDQ